MKKSKIEGLIIVAGKTGDGKSKTIADAKRMSASMPLKTVVLNDPIEYEIKGKQSR